MLSLNADVPTSTATTVPAFELSEAETLLLYLVNKTRRFPESWAARLSVSLPSDQGGPFAPLVANGSLLEAARLHSQDMLSHENLSHTGSDGSSPFQRALRAGYPTDQVGENVGYDWNYYSYSSDDVATRSNDSWFTSSGHRANMLAANWTEFGGAVAVRQPPYGTRYATEMFGRYDAGPFLTGVVFTDRNSDVDYDAGEGLGGVTITASGPMGTFSTVSMPAGGWMLKLPSGQYAVTAAGGAFSGASTVGVNVAAKNVQVDFISGRASGSVNFAPYENTAPTLDTSASPAVPPVVVGSTNPSGVAVASLLGTSVTDPDPASRSGIAVTGATGGTLGAWQYSINGGVSWLSLASASPFAATLLRASDHVRFVPQGGGAGTATIQYRAWDQTAGSAGGTVDSGTSGGTSSLSVAVETANVTVMLSNAAPTLVPSGSERLDPVREDSVVNPGTPVWRIVGPTIVDPDPGAAAGIAVIGMTGAGSGAWQYSSDGQGWFPLEGASLGKAILLRGSDIVRFVPAKDFNGSASMTYVAWDQSAGSAGGMADLSSTLSRGGSTAFSTVTATAAISVAPANDSPTLLSGAAALMLRPVAINGSFAGGGTTVGTMLGNAFLDVDAASGRGIAIIDTDAYGGTFYCNIPSAGGWFYGSMTPQCATLLGSGDSIAFVPSSGFSGTATIRFRLWDQTSGAPGFCQANLSGGDSYGGETAFSADIYTATVFVGSEGSPPSASFVVPPSPNAGISSIAIAFTRSISGLDLGDFSLARGGVGVPLSGATLTGAGASYLLSGLSNLNLSDGSYTLTLNAQQSGIASDTGSPLASSATASWSVRSSPADLIAAAADRQVTLTWSAPPPNPNAALLDYVVQFSSDGAETWTTFSDGVSTATSATIDGLANGTAYIFRVAAVTSVSESNFVQSPTATPRAAPFAPGKPSVTVGNARLQLAWVPPADNGGAPVSDYVVLWSGNGGETWTTVADGVSPTAAATISGLTNGTAYLVRVAAVNAAGTGPFAQAGPFVPQAVPGSPAGVSGVAGNGQVSLSWSRPSSDGGAAITDYVVQYRAGSSSSWSTFVDDVSPSTTATVTGLVNGSSYSFRVAAVNSVGRGSFAVSGSVTPRTVPASPSNLSAMPDNGRVQLAWTAPAANGGFAITDYVIQSSSDGATTWAGVADGVSTTTSATVSQLTNGVAYVFRVAAVTAAGQGEFVQTSTVTPRTLPTGPAGLVASAGDRSVSLSWSPPSSDGGSAIADYVVQYRVGSSSSWTMFVDDFSPSTTVAVTGLVNGTSYTFRVAAVNAAGQGPFAVPGSVTPRAVPAAPSNLSATADDGRVQLAWTPPSSNGGFSITDYVVESSSDGGDTWGVVADGVSTATTAVVQSLTNGVSYLFRVAAINAVGWSEVVQAGPVTPRTLPAAPANVVATAGRGNVPLAWAAPSSDGGSAVIDYVIEYRISSSSSWTRFVDGLSPSTTAVVTGLANGTTYVFRISAVTAAGQGAAAESAPATPRTIPGKPRNIVPTPGDGRVTLSWLAPAANGGALITNYMIQYLADGTTTWKTFPDGVSTATTTTVTGLANGTSYSFRVAAINAVGRGVFSLGPTATPRTTPSPPLAIAAAPGNGQVDLSWTAPLSHGGVEIGDYVVEYSRDNGGAWSQFSDGVSSAPLVTVTGLTNGIPYLFRVAAVNTVGVGGYGHSALVVPATVPSRPGIVNVAAVDGTAMILWAAPASDGGSPIVDYRIQMSGDAGGAWATVPDGVSTGTTAAVTGLLSGLTYQFRVSAINANGRSLFAMSLPVTI